MKDVPGWFVDNHPNANGVEIIADEEFKTLMRPHSYKLGDRFLYPGRKHNELERLVGKKVEIRGKPYDVELEGQPVREIWPGAIRAAGSSTQPDFSRLKEGITLPQREAAARPPWIPAADES